MLPMVSLIHVFDTKAPQHVVGRSKIKMGLVLMSQFDVSSSYCYGRLVPCQTYQVVITTQLYSSQFFIQFKIVISHLSWRYILLKNSYLTTEDAIVGCIVNKPDRVHAVCDNDGMRLWQTSIPLFPTICKCITEKSYE